MKMLKIMDGPLTFNLCVYLLGFLAVNDAACITTNVVNDAACITTNVLFSKLSISITVY